MAERVAALSRDVEAAREELRRTAANNRAEVEALREPCAPPPPVPSAPPSTGP